MKLQDSGPRLRANSHIPHRTDMEESACEWENTKEGSGHVRKDESVAGNIPGINLGIGLVSLLIMFQIRVVLSIENDMGDIRKALDVRDIYRYKGLV